MKTYSKELAFDTSQNNLLDLEPALRDHVEDLDFFYIIDLSDQARQWVRDSGIQHGLLTLQSLHTTCIIGMNELDEPCLLGDINNFMRRHIPRTEPYLHNSSIRTKNLCADDAKCDRNADSHLKSFLFGSPTQSVIVKDGEPVFGQWQRLSFIDLDGPRQRRILVQIIGD